jgi:hypothetical protein
MRQRFRPRGLVVVGFASGVALLGCGGDGTSDTPRGEFVCQTTREDCIATFQGTYAGTYPGGTLTIYIAEDGTIEGTVTDSNGVQTPVTGRVDETGFVEFGAAGADSFQGSIDFDSNLSGTWSKQGTSGAFTGSFVSFDPPLTPGGPDPGEVSYCDRIAAQATECALEQTGSCMEPADDEQRCLAECFLGLSCADIGAGLPLLECAETCTPSDGTRDYCGEYSDKLDECATGDTLLIFEICDTPATPSDECVWGCVLDASCAEFMDEQAVYDACRASCGV